MDIGGAVKLRQEEHSISNITPRNPTMIPGGGCKSLVCPLVALLYDYGVAAGERSDCADGDPNRGQNNAHNPK